LKRTVDHWPRVRLQEHVDLITGFPFRSNSFSTDSNDIPLVKGENLHQRYIDWAGAKRWPAAEVDLYSRFKLEVGDVVLAMDRPWIEAGLKFSWIRPSDPQALLVQRVARLRGVNGLQTDYLRYLIGSPAFTDYIKPIVTGVNVPHISASQICAFRFVLPPAEVQRKIAFILSAYDGLIENNTRRIKILEQMAQAIYREWFVEFRALGVELRKATPEEQKLTGKDVFPKGWEVIRVEELVKRVPSGKKYENKTIQSEGKVPVLDQGKSGIIGYHNDEPGVNASEANPVIVFANHTCYQRVIHFPFSAIQNVLPFVPAPQMFRNIYWLHWATKDLIKFNDYRGHWPEFMGKRTICPSPKLAQAFGELVMPIAQLIFKLENRNGNLRRIRDLLLPKLISGEVEVDRIEIAE
jgi:type I restriction enzyme S subunit